MSSFLPLSFYCVGVLAMEMDYNDNKDKDDHDNDNKMDTSLNPLDDILMDTGEVFQWMNGCVGVGKPHPMLVYKET